jgi:hypothetical protein
MAAVGVGGYLFWAVDGGLVREGNWIGIDFRVYYQTAQALVRGENIYTTGISPPYVYPPLLAILVVPLTPLNPTAAIILWKLLQHLCLLAAGWLLVRLIPPSIRPLGAGLLLLGLLTLPLREEIQVGESNSIILVLLAGALWLLGTGSNGLENDTRSGSADPNAAFPAPGQIAAGLLLSLAVSIKVLPALVVAYLWWRGPRAVAAVATVGFLLVQIITLAITPSTAYYWLTEFPGLFGQAFPFPDNQSLNAFLSRALLPTDPNLPPMQIAAGEAARPVLTWAVNLLALAGAVLVLWSSHRGRDGQGREAEGKTTGETRVRLLLEVGLVLLTTHLISGSTWPHHLIQLSVPFLGFLGAWWLAQERPGSERTGTRITALLGLSLGAALAVLLHSPSEWLFTMNDIFPGNPLVALLASSMGLWVVVLLWALVAWALHTGRNRERIVTHG